MRTTSKKQIRGLRGAGQVAQLPSGRWRLRVPVGGKRVTYGVYESQRDAVLAQDRWLVTGLLPSQEEQPRVPDLPLTTDSMDVWFTRWQEAKAERESIARGGWGGSPKTLVAIKWQRASSGDWTNYAAEASRRDKLQGPSHTG